jgi:hypothetical protein
MNIREWDPSLGMAFQGDVSIVPIPAGIKISTIDEIAPVNGRLILQEGEVSGHHHAINLGKRNFQSQPRETGDPLMVTRDPKLRSAFGAASKKTAATARMFRDPAAVNAMVSAGIMTRADLAIGCLVVEGASMLLSHEEHDSIRIPVGNYLIGNQVESAGAEERVVLD